MPKGSFVPQGSAEGEGPTPAGLPGRHDVAAILVSASAVPTLLLNENLTVHSASDSFCAAFGLRPELLPERELSELGGGEWDLPPLISLLRGMISGHARIDAYETDLRPRGREPRRISVKVARLPAVEPGAGCRLLLTVLDRTELHAMRRQNEQLSDEIRHLRQQLELRVANSLQIVASILLLAARQVRTQGLHGRPDDERDRHAAVADLRGRLASTPADEVDMHAYLRELCDSLAACMLPDRRRVILETRVGDIVLPASEATSIGLMVTEMTINAIRHASFNPNYGQIVVSMSGTPERWYLAVKDNGYGARTSQFRPGLGTGIIDALARHLGAAYAISSDGTGTTAAVERPDA
ncbi:sensor histidine kinase [Devosia sp.]|uniref:sensor histidine kinase n=1 Tax=Devosia sp. TaxID=1871048 RepID=UPI0035B1A716